MIGVSSSFFLNAFLISVLGFVGSGFLNAAHECAHKHMFQKQKSNRFWGQFWCTPLLINFSAFKRHHMLHHRYSGEARDTDPPIEFEKLHHYIRFVSAYNHVPYSVKRIANIWLGSYPHYLLNYNDHANVYRDNILLTIWLVLVVGITLIAPLEMLLGYWLPMQLSVSLLAFFALPEHYGCSNSKDLTISTRTIYSNSIFRYFQWNANFHVEHHAVPSAPADSLPEIHNGTRDSLSHFEKSYFLWHLKTIRKIVRKSTNAPA